MITIFTVPKPFRDQSKVIQTNAIRSWLNLRPSCEVILLGNEEGTAEIAQEHDIRHIPDVSCNELGTPLINSIFESAQRLSSNSIMCYVNADIIFVSDFMKAISKVNKDHPFLIIGRRWNVDMNYPIDWSRSDWEPNLLSHVRTKGMLFMAGALDYFIFPRGLWKEIPPFAVGRIGWDNWMVFRARSLRVPVIDATQMITAIHQNHSHSHLPGGEKAFKDGQEARRNKELLGGDYHALGMLDATHLLTDRGLKPAVSAKHLLRRTLTIPELNPRLVPLVQMVLALRMARKSIVSFGHKLNASRRHS